MVNLIITTNSYKHLFYIQFILILGDVDSGDDDEFVNKSNQLHQNNSNGLNGQNTLNLEQLHINIGNINHRYHEPFDEYLSSKPGSIGRKMRSTCSNNFSNDNEYVTNSYRNNEIAVNPRLSRVRHFCNGPRPETKL